MSFEFDGEKYKKASTHQKEWATKILQEFNLTGKETILDLGCGDGVITKQLAEMVPNGSVLGIDASEGMIKTAKQNNDCHNLFFELKNINELQYISKFDLIFSNAALHWVLDHKKLLTNVSNALTDAGVIRFNFAGDGNCSHFYKVIEQAMAEPQFKSFFHSFSWPWFMPTLQKYTEIISEIELTAIEIWEENADRFFETEETMIKWIDQPSIVPFLKHIPNEKQHSFRNYVVERMVKETKNNSDTCFETFRRINIKAKKGQSGSQGIFSPSPHTTKNVGPH